MAGKALGNIIAVPEPCVGSGRYDYVDARQFRCQQLLIGNLLQVRKQDDLVDALSQQGVDHRLELGRQQIHVVGLAIRPGAGRESCNLGTRGR